MAAQRLAECNGCEFRPELYYDAHYQIWVRQEAGDLLSIGMTDLSQAIAGKILHVRVRRPGTARPSGKPVATIESGKWAGPVPNVFDCVIVEANPAVLDNPGLLNDAPYGAWIARVRPQLGIAEALSHLVTGRAARRGYCERAVREEIYCPQGERTAE
ncbi:MAG: glycine cleavage system protein H [Betaproteobacteria bacterium]|nr:glycine cleavage system protein H [Betaproteobacteria bacterium]